MTKKILEIAQLGQPVLRKIAKPIKNLFDIQIQNLITNMIHTLVSGGGVGIAAPQVFKSLRLFVMQTLPVTPFPKTATIEPHAVINPKLLSHSEEIVALFERCKSFPVIRGKVPRYKHIKVSFFTEKGDEVITEYSDFASIIFQHEIDHLNGIVWLDRVEDTKSLITEQEYQKQLNEGKLL